MSIPEDKQKLARTLIGAAGVGFLGYGVYKISTGGQKGETEEEKREREGKMILDMKVSMIFDKVAELVQQGNALVGQKSDIDQSVSLLYEKYVANCPKFDVANTKGCIFPTDIPNLNYPIQSENGHVHSQDHSDMNLLSTNTLTSGGLSSGGSMVQHQKSLLHMLSQYDENNLPPEMTLEEFQTLRAEALGHSQQNSLRPDMSRQHGMSSVQESAHSVLNRLLEAGYDENNLPPGMPLEAFQEIVAEASHMSQMSQMSQMSHTSMGRFSQLGQQSHSQVNSSMGPSLAQGPSQNLENLKSAFQAAKEATVVSSPGGDPAMSGNPGMGGVQGAMGICDPNGNQVVVNPPDMPQGGGGALQQVYQPIVNQVVIDPGQGQQLLQTGQLPGQGNIVTGQQGQPGQANNTLQPNVQPQQSMARQPTQVSGSGPGSLPPVSSVPGSMVGQNSQHPVSVQPSLSQHPSQVQPVLSHVPSNGGNSIIVDKIDDGTNGPPGPAISPQLSRANSEMVLQGAGFDIGMLGSIAPGLTSLDPKIIEAIASGNIEKEHIALIVDSIDDKVFEIPILPGFNKELAKKLVSAVDPKYIIDILKSGNFDPQQIVAIAEDPNAIDAEILKEVLIDLIGNNKDLINELMGQIPNLSAVQEVVKKETGEDLVDLITSIIKDLDAELMKRLAITFIKPPPTGAGCNPALLPGLDPGLCFDAGKNIISALSDNVGLIKSAKIAAAVAGAAGGGGGGMGGGMPAGMPGGLGALGGLGDEQDVVTELAKNQSKKIKKGSSKASMKSMKSLASLKRSDKDGSKKSKSKFGSLFKKKK